MTGAAKGGLSFFALPDNRQLQVMLNENGQIEFGRRNVLTFPDETQDFLRKEAPEYWYPQPNERFPAKAAWVINKCTDPDTYGEALDWLEARYGDQTMIFNHPAAVRLTTRDRIPSVLGDIPNLIAPACVRFRFVNEADLMRVFRKNRFQFPVLVRPSELQAGKGLVKVDSDADWAKLMYTNWYLQDHFMTQFVDSQTEEGAYLKVRVLFLGGEPFLRHAKASSNWLVHNSRREDVAGFPDREVQFIEELESDSDFMGVCRSVADRLPLDYFGMDIGVDLPRKRFVLFEANPSMNVFFPLREGLSEAAVARREKLQQRAAKHLDRLIRTPDMWRSAAVGRSPR